MECIHLVYEFIPECPANIHGAFEVLHDAESLRDAILAERASPWGPEILTVPVGSPVYIHMPFGHWVGWHARGTG